MDKRPKNRRKRRSFNKEFKAEAVRLCRVGDRPVTQVARDLDLTETALRQWLKQADIDAGQGPPDALTTHEREELARLRRDVRRLEMEREILRAAIRMARRMLMPDRARRHDHAKDARFGRIVVSGRTADPRTEAPTAQSRAQTCARSRMSYRDPLRAPERHPLGDAAAGDGLRVRDDLLASAP